MGKFIAILGPVGVGKSTMITCLINALNRQRVKVSGVVIKSFHGLIYLLWRSIALMVGQNNKCAPWSYIPRSGRVKLARCLEIISIYLDALLVIPLKLIKVLLLKRLGYTVISEEYIYSSVYDHLFTLLFFKLPINKINSLPIKIMYCYACKYAPDHVIILNASDEIIRKRWEIRGRGEHSIEYVKMQRWFLRNHVYKYLGGRINATIIDNSNLGIRKTLDTLITTISR